jgi:CspA family cold shock protein
MQTDPSERVLGRVKWFDTTKAFGFIEPDTGPDIFVHLAAVQRSGLDRLVAGDRVSFIYEPDRRNPSRMRASSLRLIEEQ